MSNEPRKGHAFLAVVRHTAAPVAALLLGATAVVLLDSGTTQLPSAAPGPSSAPVTPHEKVTVSPSAASTKPAHRRVARQAPRKQTQTGVVAPQTGAPTRTSPAGSPVSSSPVSRPVHHSRTGGKPHAKPPSHGGGTGSGGTSSGGGTPTTQPPPTATSESRCTHPRGRALSHRKHPKGLALGHRSHPCKNRTKNAPQGLAQEHQKQNRGNGHGKGHDNGNGKGHHPDDNEQGDHGSHGRGQGDG